MGNKFVAILIGSDSDLKVMQSTMDSLEHLEVSWEIQILSAHRTPDEVRDYISDADTRGCAVYIAAAGLAAHLAGAVAANTLKPVIGVPLDAGTLGGNGCTLGNRSDAGWSSRCLCRHWQSRRQKRSLPSGPNHGTW